jgi:hypothetical protein
LFGMKEKSHHLKRRASTKAHPSTNLFCSLCTLRIYRVLTRWQLWCRKKKNDQYGPNCRAKLTVISGLTGLGTWGKVTEAPEAYRSSGALSTRKLRQGSYSEQDSALVDPFFKTTIAAPDQSLHFDSPRRSRLGAAQFFPRYSGPFRIYCYCFKSPSQATAKGWTCAADH